MLDTIAALHRVIRLSSYLSIAGWSQTWIGSDLWTTLGVAMPDSRTFTHSFIYVCLCTRTSAQEGRDFVISVHCCVPQCRRQSIAGAQRLSLIVKPKIKPHRKLQNENHIVFPSIFPSSPKWQFGYLFRKRKYFCSRYFKICIICWNGVTDLFDLICNLFRPFLGLNV